MRTKQRKNGAVARRDINSKLYLEFGRLIKDERLRQNLTQDDLAALMHVSRTTITMLERGKQGCSLHMAYMLAGALKCDIGEILPAEN